jgi:lipid A disaccharide synthetase
MQTSERKDRGASTLCVTPASRRSDWQDYLPEILRRITVVKKSKCDDNHIFVLIKTIETT